MTITLHPGSVSLNDLETIYWTGVPARLDPAFDAGIAKAAARIAEIAAGNAPVYGINTGFGKLASIKIDSADVTTLQRNLILSHCCGVGAAAREYRAADHGAEAGLARARRLRRAAGAGAADRRHA